MFHYFCVFQQGVRAGSHSDGASSIISTGCRMSGESRRGPSEQVGWGKPLPAGGASCHIPSFVHLFHFLSVSTSWKVRRGEKRRQPIRAGESYLWYKLGTPELRNCLWFDPKHIKQKTAEERTVPILFSLPTPTSQ